MQKRPQPFGSPGGSWGSADPHATFLHPHRRGVRRGGAARPGRRAGVQDAVADLRGAARPQGPRHPRPGLRATSPRSACTRCASCSTGTTSRRRPTRASSRSSTRPIPASYDWSAYDAVVDGIKARGWNLLLTVSGPVPRWATNGARDTLTRPSPTEFQKFVHAVGAALRHEGRHLEHLERAQPAAVPDAAVLGAPHPALAGDLPQAVPRRPARPGRRRPRQRAGAARRDLAARHGQGRRAADLPARRAVPGLQVPQDQHELREAARPPATPTTPTRRARARPSSPRSPTTSRSACSRG